MTYGWIALLAIGSSLWSISYAAPSAEDGLFGTYFSNMVWSCTTQEVLTGFSGANDANYGKRQCRTLKSLLWSIFGSPATTIPPGSVVVGFNSDGSLKYASGVLLTPGTNEIPNSLTIKNNLAVSGNLSVAGDLTVSGSLIINGQKIVPPPDCTGTGKALQYTKAAWYTCATLSVTELSQPFSVTYTKDAALSSPTSSYTLGETMYGYITGGDPKNTWACMEAPTNIGGCNDRANWRQLGTTTSSTNDWYYNTTTKRIELRAGFYIDPTYPTGTYKSFTANGQNGTATQNTFTVAKPTAACEWQPKAVVGPIGKLNIDYNKVDCTQALNGQNSQEISGMQQIVATCACITTTTPPPNTNITTPFSVTYTKDAALSSPTSSYTLGETMYGYITGGDPKNTWACMEAPTNIGGCNDRANWRQLGTTTSSTNDWYYNTTTKRIELRAGFYIDPTYPTGTYKSFTANGQNGTATQNTFTVAKPAISITQGKFAGQCGGNGLVDTEYYCGWKPSGGWWVEVGGGCYHRCIGNISTWLFAGQCGGNWKEDTQWLCASPSYGGSPSWWVDVGNNCYHKCK